MSRVTEIRYVGYGVENFDAERKFYADDWGLVEVESQRGRSTSSILTNHLPCCCRACA